MRTKLALALFLAAVTGASAQPDTPADSVRPAGRPGSLYSNDFGGFVEDTYAPETRPGRREEAPPAGRGRYDTDLKMDLTGPRTLPR